MIGSIPIFSIMGYQYAGMKIEKVLAPRQQNLKLTIQYRTHPHLSFDIQRTPSGSTRTLRADRRPGLSISGKQAIVAHGAVDRDRIRGDGGRSVS